MNIYFCWSFPEKWRVSFGSQDSPKLWCFLLRNLGWFCCLLKDVDGNWKKFYGIVSLLA